MTLFSWVALVIMAGLGFLGGGSSIDGTILFVVDLWWSVLVRYVAGLLFLVG